MKDSTDGSSNIEKCAAGINVPKAVTIPSALARLRESLARIAFDSKSCLETNGWRKKPYGKTITSLLSKNRWPELLRDLNRLEEAFSDRQHFEEMMEVLKDRYFDIDVDQMCQKISQLLEFTSKAKQSLSDIDPAEMAELESDSAQYNLWADRICEFALEYSEIYNELARFIHRENPSTYPWISPIRPTVEIDSPYL